MKVLQCEIHFKANPNPHEFRVLCPNIVETFSEHFASAELSHSNSGRKAENRGCRE